MTYIQPILAICLLMLLAINLVRREWRHRRLYSVVIASFLFLWSWPPIAFLFSGTLEWQYPIRQFPADDPQAIVVLSGSSSPRSPSQPEDLSGIDTYMRTAYGSWLYKNWRALPVVVSGGIEARGRQAVVVAQVMRHVLRQEGVPDDMIWTESKSTSTYENARYSAELLRGKGIHNIVLVTDAVSMLRAQMSFQHQGLAVSPAPCCYRVQAFHWTWTQVFPSTSAIHDNETTLHEWVALVWYRIRGRI